MIQFWRQSGYVFRILDAEWSGSCVGLLDAGKCSTASPSNSGYNLSIIFNL